MVLVIDVRDTLGHWELSRDSVMAQSERRNYETHIRNAHFILIEQYSYTLHWDYSVNIILTFETTQCRFSVIILHIPNWDIPALLSTQYCITFVLSVTYKMWIRLILFSCYQSIVNSVPPRKYPAIDGDIDFDEQCTLCDCFDRRLTSQSISR